MASEVDIANLALAHLGDDATVSSFDPPEGSEQAEHCARFYPIARDALLEKHPWRFATRRTTLASLTSGSTQWDYSYARPNNALVVFAVLPPGASDDYSAPSAADYTDYTGVNFSYAPSVYQTEPFSSETDEDGNDLILTDVEDAEARWIARVTDSDKFSPLFTLALARLLAHFLAGPVLKGEIGMAVASAQLKIFEREFAEAAKSDAGQAKTEVTHSVPWIAAR